MGLPVLWKWIKFFFLRLSSIKNFVAVEVVRGVVEIKRLQVPGKQTQSAERAKKRRRDKRFPFKLIPLRPSRFPLQDLQNSDKNLAPWIWRVLGWGDHGKERQFFCRGRQTEQSDTVRGKEPVGERPGWKKGWACSSRVHQAISVSQQWTTAGTSGAIKPELYVWWGA